MYLTYVTEKLYCSVIISYCGVILSSAQLQNTVINIHLFFLLFHPWCSYFFSYILESITVDYTYSLVWEESEIKWASRWDIYLSMSNAQIHWFSILNSLVVVFFLAGVLAAIIIRTLKKDIANYNKLDEDMVS